MGKKKSGKKAAPELSKKARKKLEEREARIAAELAEREKAATKKAKKKSGKKAKADKGRDEILDLVKSGKAELLTPETIDTIGTAHERGEVVIEIEAEAPIETPAEYVDPTGQGDEGLVGAASRLHIANMEATPEQIIAAADRVLADPNASEGARKSAEKAKKRALAETESDDEIKARVAAKRAARAEKAADTRPLLDGETEAQYQMRRLREQREADAIAKTRDAVDAIKSAVEEVETEQGRVFTAGESVATDAAPVVQTDDFAKPSEGLDARPDFETNGLNQYKVKRPSDGKMVGYTRVTTYISCLEDTSKITEWKLRILLEGVATAEEFGERGESPTARVRELAHIRDVAIAKARKADRKGKLNVGDLAALTERAWSDFKKEMNALADELFEIGGGRERATKGTDIHALTEIHDEKGIDAVGELLTEGKITPADMADVEAYREAIAKLGAKIVEQERVIVNDDLKVAGRLDRVVMVKLPEIRNPKTGEVIRPAEARARRRVLDIKTGSTLDFSRGKIAQQIEMYAGATGYDLETHEREDLKLDRTLGLVLHLPAGSGKATVHIVDLVLGRKGNRLAGDVRAWRNEGKRAIDPSVDVLAMIEGSAE